jgi:hypothetical protein
MKPATMWTPLALLTAYYCFFSQAIAAPAANSIELTHGLEKRCTFNDGIGDIDCAYFSIVVGADNLQGDNAEGVPFQFTVTANNFQTSFDGSCDNDGNDWQSFDTELPWVLVIHLGNICAGFIGGPDDLFDNYVSVNPSQKQQ